LLLHVAIKLPTIVEALRRPISDGEGGATGLTRRGLLTASGAGVGLLVATTVGQSVTSLQRLALLAPRQPKDGPLGVAVNKTAAQARVTRVGADWQLAVRGPRPYTIPLAALEAAAVHESRLPIACVEGWSVDAQWRGVRLIDVVRRAGGDTGSKVRVASMQQRGAFRTSVIDGAQLEHALLATHLNGVRLDLDHGYPVRLIAPDRAGVFNTKWIASVEVE
jgi:DMSO/TMAO reductase YedYZ molybdopterin-dependent catalytic subunit